MKSRFEIAKGMIRKAEGDLTLVRLALSENSGLDSACFLAQQAAEKYLKAYLVAVDIDYPFTHNLEILIDLCAKQDDAFLTQTMNASTLTPFAIDIRYDAAFSADFELARKILGLAEEIVGFVRDRLPEGLLEEAP